ncbi:hypothetical protein HmCms171_03662 [Escherichia coli]|uniref:hypothetical protein n=1 Tax=Escherichia coli TaxID=562 RepID=UPI0003351183|nr:hypothetical protein [Escherichia coli]EOW19028.1 hypothetical protein A1WU_03970 [Escherichia coli KTE108]MDC3554163.1 hypothetical protein [Escherichia coli]QLX18625.1 hypothetical protein HV238_16055 [Escherichia coli]UVF01602.1 hypothetical protein KW498_08565 [Escherichia coli]GCT39699.1 hypothetical protein HmCms171_03662 [Escherichia coli]
MSGMLASTAAAVGIIDKAVGIAKKLADDGGELDKATLKLELGKVRISRSFLPKLTR